MSYNPTGGAGMYAPPPPPNKPRSPWVAVGLGCLGLSVLGFGGCIVLVNSVKNKVVASMKKPLSPEQAVSSLNGLPVYPGATVDIPTTKIMRGTSETMSAMMGKAKMSMVVFRVKDVAPEKVGAWYDKNLAAAGWHASAGDAADQFASQNSKQMKVKRQFVKGDQQAVIQANDKPLKTTGDAGDDSKGTTLIITLISGMKTAAQ